MTQNNTFPTLPALRVIVTMLLAVCLALPLAALPADANPETEAMTPSEASWIEQIWAGATQWLADLWTEDEDSAPLSIHGQGERGPMVDPSGRR